VHDRQRVAEHERVGEHVDLVEVQHDAIIAARGEHDQAAESVSSDAPCATSSPRHKLYMVCGSGRRSVSIPN